MEVEAHIETPGKTLLRSTPFPALFIVLWGWKRVFGQKISGSEIDPTALCFLIFIIYL